MSTSLTKAMMLVAVSTVASGISPVFAHESEQQHSHSTVSYVEYNGKDQPKSRYEYRVNNKAVTTDEDGTKTSIYTVGQRELRGRRSFYPYYFSYRLTHHHGHGHNHHHHGHNRYDHDHDHGQNYPAVVIAGKYNYWDFRDYPEAKYHRRRDMALSLDFGGSKVTGVGEAPVDEDNQVIIKTEYPGKHGKCDNDKPHSHTITPK